MEVKDRRFAPRTGTALGRVELARPSNGLPGVRQALARLRDIQQVPLLLESATQQVCSSLGFDRALLLGLQGSKLDAVSACFKHRPDWALEILELTRQRPPRLTSNRLETEILRTRCAAIIRDTAKGDVFCPALVEAMRTTSYVVAPIVSSEAVIGFFHADRHFQEQAVDEHDRDLLWTFAEGFGYAFERSVLAERLRTQHEHITRLMSSTDAVIRENSHAHVELRSYDEAATLAHAAAGIFIAPDPVMGGLLTARELEVLQLLALGATNGQIAGRLFVTEGTVKSHVKQILRKLHSANRTEAVSRYLQIAERDAMRDVQPTVRAG